MPLNYRSKCAVFLGAEIHFFGGVVLGLFDGGFGGDMYKGGTRGTTLDRSKVIVGCVNSSEKIPKSATPKVSRGGELYIGMCECQHKIPQNVCSLKRCSSFVIYRPS